MLKPQRLPYRPFRTGLFAFAALIGLAGLAHADVSLSIGKPGFYGRIDIGGGYPPPALIYPYPVIITPSPMMGPPVYLHVPPRHIKNWRRHCRHYGACDEQVYFVQDSWYHREYAPRHMGYRPPPPPHVHYHEHWRHHRMHDGYRWHGYGHLPPARHRRHHDDDD